MQLADRFPPGVSQAGYTWRVAFKGTEKQPRLLRRAGPYRDVAGVDVVGAGVVVHAGQLHPRRVVCEHTSSRFSQAPRSARAGVSARRRPLTGQDVVVSVLAAVLGQQS